MEQIKDGLTSCLRRRVPAASSPCFRSKGDQKMSMTTTSNTTAPKQSEDPHPLIEKVRHSTVPIGELIGFRVDEITAGRAVASLRSGPQHAQSHGHAARRCALRLGGRGDGDGFRVDARVR